MEINAQNVDGSASVARNRGWCRSMSVPVAGVTCRLGGGTATLIQLAQSTPTDCSARLFFQRSQQQGLYANL